MNRKFAVALAIPMIMVTFLGLVFAYSADGIHANTKLSKFELVGSGDWTRIYIYVMNPTWQTVEITSFDTDWYVNGEYYKSLTTWYPPEWIFTEGEWDATVLPFENSAILWFRWTYGPEPPYYEPAGLNTMKFTIHATTDGQDIQLNTQVSFRTL